MKNGCDGGVHVPTLSILPINRHVLISRVEIGKRKGRPPRPALAHRSTP